MFPIISFLLWQILGIVGSQLKFKKLIHVLIYSHVLILTSKNWLNDERVDCKAPSNLVELIDFEIDLEEELDEFEGLFD